ncbi:hypothetical protein J6590_004206 [Homalodisca vitripennis]|nr:hypothetical protein J6590_004206 [Homalodisca vitripennis]
MMYRFRGIYNDKIINSSLAGKNAGINVPKWEHEVQSFQQSRDFSFNHEIRRKHTTKYLVHVEQETLLVAAIAMVISQKISEFWCTPLRTRYPGLRLNVLRHCLEPQ